MQTIEAAVLRLTRNREWTIRWLGVGKRCRNPRIPVRTILAIYLKCGPSREASRPRRLGDPDDTDIIIVDDEYEDVGQRLVESDDLNISGPSRFPHSTRRNSHPIADGPATTLLRRDVRLAPEDDRGQESDDPIESYEPSEISVNQKPGNVKKKVQKYEKLESESIPRLDFSTMPDKPNVKRSMKPKVHFLVLRYSILHS
jgi:hypothetical protein